MKRNRLQEEIGEMIFDFCKKEKVMSLIEDIDKWEDLPEELKELYSMYGSKIILFLNIRYRTKL